MLKPVRSLLTSVALLLLGNGLLNTLLALRGASEGFSTLLLGFILSGYFLGFICGTWVSGRLIRRMGHIRTFAFCAALCASAALLHILLVNPWFWLALRFIFGLSFVTIVTVIESWLNSQAASTERGRLFAVYMVTNLGALAVAQQVLRLGTPETFTLFAIAAVLICWAVLPITLTRRVQPSIPERPKSSIRELLRFAPLPVAIAALSGLGMGSFWTMTPVYVSGLGFAAADVGLIMSSAIVGGALLQIPIGRFSDTRDRRLVTLCVVFTAAVLALALPFVSSRWSVTALFFAWGGLAFSLYPLAVAQLIDQLHPDEIVSGTADILVLHGAGCAGAPLLAGLAMSLIGNPGLPLYIATVFAVLGVYTLYRRRWVSDLVLGGSAHFEPMVQTSSEALAVLLEDQQGDLFGPPQPQPAP